MDKKVHGFIHGCGNKFAAHLEHIQGDTFSGVSKCRAQAITNWTNTKQTHNRDII